MECRSALGAAVRVKTGSKCLAAKKGEGGAQNFLWLGRALEQAETVQGRRANYAVQSLL